jgi:hypothetical protein
VILRSEMRKSNTRLCVVLEPKEFQTNPIISFCDETKSRDKWITNAIFLMTKFDKQLEDSRMGSKANAFFHQNFVMKNIVVLVMFDSSASLHTRLCSVQSQSLHCF